MKKSTRALHKAAKTYNQWLDKTQSGVAVEDQLQAIYAKLPHIECQRKCNRACGPIGFAPIEVAVLEAAGHQVPVAQNHIIHGALTCSALKGGGCSIYDYRPGICRLYGLVEPLACPHGCLPERWLSEKEGHGFLKAIEELTQGQSTLTCDRETYDEIAQIINR